MKRIVMSNGENKYMECDFEFLEMYRGQAYKEFRKFKNNFNVTEDEKQELDIVIFKAYKTYDEVHCFSTHLGWKLKQHFHVVFSNVKSKKRDLSDYEIIDLDFKLSNNKGDGEHNIHDIIEDVAASNYENKLIERELLTFIDQNLDEFEKKLLLVNLKAKRMIDLADEYNTSRQNINNKNRKFKKKLLALIEEFNGDII